MKGWVGLSTMSVNNLLKVISGSIVTEHSKWRRSGHPNCCPGRGKHQYRLAESELCRKSLPVELLVHFTEHIDVTAQEIRSGDNLRIRGPDTTSVRGGAVQIIRDIFVEIVLEFRSNCGTFHMPNNSAPYNQVILFNTCENKADCPEVTVAVYLPWFCERAVAEWVLETTWSKQLSQLAVLELWPLRRHFECSVTIDGLMSNIFVAVLNRNSF